MKNLKNNRKSRYKIISLTSLSTIALSALLGDAVRSSAMLGRLVRPLSVSSMKSITSTGSGASVKSATSKIQGGINGQPSIKIPQSDIAGRFQANSPSSSALNYNKFNSSLLPGSKKTQYSLSTGVSGTSSTGVGGASSTGIGGVSSGRVQGVGSSGVTSSSTTQGVTSSTGSTPGAIPKAPSLGSLRVTSTGGGSGSTTSTTGGQAPRPVGGDGSVVSGGDSITSLPTGSGLQRRGSTSSTSSWDSSSTQSGGGAGAGATTGTSSRRSSLGFIDSGDPDAERRAKINKRLKWAGVGVLGIGAALGIGIGVGVAESNKNKNNGETGNDIPPKNVPIPEKPQYSISTASSPEGYLYTDE